MICDRCKHEVNRVIKVNKFKNSNVRVRRCEKCGHLWETVEKLGEHAKKVQQEE